MKVVRWRDIQVGEFIMRSVVITGVSTLALALAGCSMFHSGKSSSASTANRSSSPAYSAAQTAQQAPSYASPSNERSRASVSAGEVRQAQQKLKQDNDYRGALDGKLGPQTERAIMEFQKKNGLQQTGSLDGQTLSKLGVEQTPTSGSSMPPSQRSK